MNRKVRVQFTGETWLSHKCLLLSENTTRDVTSEVLDSREETWD